MTHLACLQNLVEDNLGEFAGDFGGVDFSVFDLRLDVLLLVGQEFVELTVTLNVRLSFQQLQRCFDLGAQLCHVLIEVRSHQHTEIADGRFELADVFHQKQHFEQTDCQFVVELFFGQGDRRLDLAFERRTNPAKH